MVETNSPNKKQLSPEEQIREREKALKSYEGQQYKEIGKETKKEIFIERHKEKIFKYTRFGCITFASIVFFAIAISAIFNYIIVPPKSSPTPTPTSQEERLKIEVGETAFIPTLGRQNSYDVIAEIKNFDENQGASELSYEMVFLDVLDNEVGRRAGYSYILPLQSRHIVELGVSTKGPIDEIRVTLNPVRIEVLAGPLDNPQEVLEMKETGTEIQNGKTRVWANILNTSQYDFSKVDVNFIVYDANGHIIGVNYTNLDTVISQTKRSASVLWDYIVPTKVERITTEANVNLFEKGSIIITGGKQELEY